MNDVTIFNRCCVLPHLKEAFFMALNAKQFAPDLGVVECRLSRSLERVLVPLSQKHLWVVGHSPLMDFTYLWDM